MRAYGQIEKAQFENSASDTVSASTGRFFVDTTAPLLAKAKIYLGVAWFQFKMSTKDGGALKAVRVLTVGPNDIMTSSDEVLVVQKGIAGTSLITLPASPETGRICTVVDGKGDANTQNITVQPAAGTINGAANKIISTAYGLYRLVYNGSEWTLI